MRFLGLGDTCDLGAMYLRLQGWTAMRCESLHRPSLWRKARSPAWWSRSTDWRAALDWVRAAGDEGIVLFENVAKSRGELQDKRCAPKGCM